MEPLNATKFLRWTLIRLVWTVRFSVPTLFQANVQATAEGKTVLPESVLNIRDWTDARKTEQARKMLAEFLAPRAIKGDEQQLNCCPFRNGFDGFRRFADGDRLRRSCLSR